MDVVSTGRNSGMYAVQIPREKKKGQVSHPRVKKLKLSISEYMPGDSPERRPRTYMRGNE